MSTAALPQHLPSRCCAAKHFYRTVSQFPNLLSLSIRLPLSTSFSPSPLPLFPSSPQEACALLLEESLHYLQAKFLCGSAAEQAARAFHSNMLPFGLYPSSTFGPAAAAASSAVHRLGLVIDGRTLAYALDKSLEDKFLAVARSCRSVLCCRSTPLQKSMVVKLVRNKLKVMTLAIGRPLFPMNLQSLMSLPVPEICFWIFMLIFNAHFGLISFCRINLAFTIKASRPQIHCLA